MLHVKLLLAACLGTLVYVFMSITFGRDGMWVYRQLESQKKVIAAQTELIQKLNTELVLEHTALLKDRDVIAAYARRLDYVASDEKLVKITGLKPFQRSLYNTGTAIKHTDCEYLSEDICKSAGFLFFAAALVILLMADAVYGARAALKTQSERKEFAHGIAVYDMPQVR